MSENTMTRRGALAGAALALLAGKLTAQDAQHVHQAAGAAKQTGGVYKPRFFGDHQWKTVQRITAQIFPKDGVSPSAIEAGAPEFLDLMAASNEEIGYIYSGGLSWLDAETMRRYGAPYVDAKGEQQIEMLDLLAYRRNTTPQLKPGIDFFAWIRKMTADAYYTSPEGIKDLGFQGNGALSQFQVPAEAIEYAVKRSPLT